MFRNLPLKIADADLFSNEWNSEVAINHPINSSKKIHGTCKAKRRKGDPWKKMVSTKITRDARTYTRGTTCEGNAT